MKNILVPYGKCPMSVDVDDNNLLGVFNSTLPQAAADPFQEVVNAFDNPIGSVTLEEMARGKKKCRYHRK